MCSREEEIRTIKTSESQHVNIYATLNSTRLQMHDARVHAYTHSHIPTKQRIEKNSLLALYIGTKHETKRNQISKINDDEQEEQKCRV